MIWGLLSGCTYSACGPGSAVHPSWALFRLGDKVAASCSGVTSAGAYTLLQKITCISGLPAEATPFAEVVSPQKILPHAFFVAGHLSA